ncbi:MAG: hypothetical protein WBQ08_07275 [Candidatus Sulfotelmatobacter sp.]
MKVHLLPAIAMCIVAASGFTGTQSPSQPLTEPDIIRLLHAHVPEEQLSKRLRQEKISFVITPSILHEFQQSGASSELLQTIREVQPQGLVWGPAKQLALSDHAMVEITPLVAENGKDYFAFTGDDHRVRLATNSSGTWKTYDVAPNLEVGNNPAARVIGLAVHAGVAYIPMIAVPAKMQILVAYNPSGNMAGPWLQSAVYTTDSSYLQDPSATISGDSLLIAFDDVGNRKNSNDVFVAKVPLRNLTGSGTAPSVAVTNVTKANDVAGGASDDHPQIVAVGNTLNMAWQEALKSLVFARGQSAGQGTSWPRQWQTLHTATDEADKSLQLSAAGDTLLIAGFIGNPDRNDSLGCCDVWATTNGGGTWSTQSIGRTGMALESPGVAVSDCGPSIGFSHATSGNSGVLTVGTFADGKWKNQDLRASNPGNPRLAATPSGLDLIYVSGWGQITFESAVCFPPPAPLGP